MCFPSLNFLLMLNDKSTLQIFPSNALQIWIWVFQFSKIHLMLCAHGSMNFRLSFHSLIYFDKILRFVSSLISSRFPSASLLSLSLSSIPFSLCPPPICPHMAMGLNLNTPPLHLFRRATSATCCLACYLSLSLSLSLSLKPCSL